jgi:hypothetical protein
MLFKTKYSQETLENFKSLIFDEKLFKKIVGFVSKNKWIYFEPEVFNKISEKKIRSIFQVKMTRVKGERQKNCKLFAYL